MLTAEDDSRKLHPLALNWRASRGLEVLAKCPLVPVEAFGPLSGLDSQKATYKLLAYLRSAGLAEVHNVDLGVLLGNRRRRLWCITEQGRSALLDAPGGDRAGRSAHPTRRTRRLSNSLSLRVACYWLLAFSLSERRKQGTVLTVQGWEYPWVRVVRAEEGGAHARIKLPAAAYIGPNTRVLLLPDFGTAPVARFRETVRRLVRYGDQIKGSAADTDELLVATPDPDGLSTRAGAWSTLLRDVMRREQSDHLSFRVVNWAHVVSSLGTTTRSAIAHARQRNALESTDRAGAHRDQVLHLLGRHPLLTVDQLALLLGRTSSQIRRVERELSEIGWLQPTGLGERSIDLAFGSRRVSQLGLVELTNQGRRRVADMLGLDTAAVARYHGLSGSGRAHATRQQRVARALAHTVGTNDIFVAFALAAAAARRGGSRDELSEWRSAAACERRQCKPDGYGLYSHDGTGYGFLLEYDRATESARKYAAKFRAYYRYRDTGQAMRDYDGFPVILFVTISASAEDRIAEQAYAAWFSRGTDPLPILLTTTELISSQTAGVLGSIWRMPGQDSGKVAQRRCLFPSVSKTSWPRVPRVSRLGSTLANSVPAQGDRGL